ncbi:MAG: HAD-IA family hydrolase [Gammaproteobacteria bacterium]|nr:HAD-IA family hydrolase [Gammaproteobacteria bacterium]
MPACTAVCFDLFNTLVSVGEVPDSVGRFTADVLGVDREVWNTACFGPGHEICKPTLHEDILTTLAHSIDPSISSARIREAVRDRQARFDHALCHVRPGTLHTLQILKQAGLRLALISNASTGEISAWAASPLAPMFDVTVFSCECGLKKPEPAIYQHALEQLGVEAAACVYVGDGGSQEFHGAGPLGMRTLLTREFLQMSRYEKVMAEQGEMIGGEINTLQELMPLLL